MVNNQEPTSALEKVLLRALAAGLATPLEGARALAQLDASRLTFPAEEDHYDGLIDDSHRGGKPQRPAGPKARRKRSNSLNG